MTADPGRDRGSASLLLLTFGLLFVAAGMVGASIGASRVARHEARTAADLGALAGAQHAIEGRDVACAEAARIVEANSGTLVTCAARGLDLLVTAEVPAGMLRARATARAGPVAPLDGFPRPRPIGGTSSSGAVLCGWTGQVACRSTVMSAERRRQWADPAQREMEESADSTEPSTATAPVLCKGWLPLPHFGDWMQDGQPSSHRHEPIASRVADSQSVAMW